GGTGQLFDWSLWPGNASKPLVLAGGLTPVNVAEAVVLTQPYAVDVCGGVETAHKGKKDPEKVMRFVKEVRSVGIQ
ncbi:MAG: N-(5'-phosphoribosyl)anthranilate isomerase, partial [Gammaproteobacteria bacterium]|nr:N-(5'-phosphoribosyl)anthranilate isomerase [Gammaproteobacteria bacterium]